MRRHRKRHRGRFTRRRFSRSPCHNGTAPSVLLARLLLREPMRLEDHRLQVLPAGGREVQLVLVPERLQAQQVRIDLARGQTLDHPEPVEAPCPLVVAANSPVAMQRPAATARARHPCVTPRTSAAVSAGVWAALLPKPPPSGAGPLGPAAGGPLGRDRTRVVPLLARDLVSEACPRCAVGSRAGWLPRSSNRIPSFQRQDTPGFDPKWHELATW